MEIRFDWKKRVEANTPKDNRPCALMLAQDLEHIGVESSLTRYEAANMLRNMHLALEKLASAAQEIVTWNKEEHMIDDEFMEELEISISLAKDCLK